MQTKVELEIESWLRHRGYAEAQIKRSVLPADVSAKIADCLARLDHKCVLDTGVDVTSTHLVLARVVVDPGTRALEVGVGWFGAGSGAMATACSACRDQTWREPLARELAPMATFLEKMAELREGRRGPYAESALTAPGKD